MEWERRAAVADQYALPLHAWSLLPLLCAVRAVSGASMTREEFDGSILKAAEWLRSHPTANHAQFDDEFPLFGLGCPLQPHNLQQPQPPAHTDQLTSTSR